MGMLSSIDASPRKATILLSVPMIRAYDASPSGRRWNELLSSTTPNLKTEATSISEPCIAAQRP